MIFVYYKEHPDDYYRMWDGDWQTVEEAEAFMESVLYIDDWFVSDE